MVPAKGRGKRTSTASTILETWDMTPPVDYSGEVWRMARRPLPELVGTEP
jgi:hypothetical protein